MFSLNRRLFAEPRAKASGLPATLSFHNAPSLPKLATILFRTRLVLSIKKDAQPLARCPADDYAGTCPRPRFMRLVAVGGALSFVLQIASDPMTMGLRCKAQDKQVVFRLGRRS
jgi:hypothetical protein